MSRAMPNQPPTADEVRGILKVMQAGSQRVVIENIGNRDGIATTFVISDEGGEFARASTIHDALHYAADLLYGPSTTGVVPLPDKDERGS